MSADTLSGRKDLCLSEFSMGTLLLPCTGRLGRSAENESPRLLHGPGS